MKTLINVLISLFILSLTSCRTGFENTIPPFSVFDFSTADGNWQVNWRRGGMNNLQWSDVEFFNVNLRMQNPAIKEYKFNLQVMANGVKIGIIRVTVPLGQQTPSYVYLSNEGAKVTPAGAPSQIADAFWLACTTNHGRLRGNAGRINIGNANVVLRLGSDHSRLSTGHHLNCV